MNGGGGDAGAVPRINRAELALMVANEPLVTFLLLLAAIASVAVAVWLAARVQARLAARKALKAH